MEQSILKSTKKILNVPEDDTSFDQDILTHINSGFSHLNQLGIGPVDGFDIEDDEADWEDFGIVSIPMLSAVKNNIHLRVRLIFDPPQLPHVLSALREQLLESDTRILMMRETTSWSDPDPPASSDLSDQFEGVEPIVDGGGA